MPKNDTVKRINQVHTDRAAGGAIVGITSVTGGSTHDPVTLDPGCAPELTLSVQKLSLAAVLTPTEHTAIGDSSPHHAPVTAGTGISLSGQQVSINLAADLTWTGNQTFQGQNSHRHILPEATDTYDIGSATRLWRAGYLSTLYSIIFAESTIQLIGGSFMIPKSTGTLPEVGSGDSTINFGQTMTPDDHLLIRSYDAGGMIKSEYIKVGTLVSGTTYNVTRDEAGAHATDPAWPDGTPYAVLGQAGNGRIELDAVTSPRISILTQGAAYNEQTEVYRVGDLNGNWGYSATTYGLAVGEYASSQANLTYDTSNGLRLRIYNTDYIQLDTAGNAMIRNKLQLKGYSSALAIGKTPPTSASNGTGIWLDRTGLYALTSSSAKTVVNAGGLRVARDSSGLRFVSSATITTDTAGSDGRIYYKSGDTALVIESPGGYLNIDVGTAGFRANISGSYPFWKFMSKGTDAPGDAHTNIQLAFGTTSDNYVILEQVAQSSMMNMYLGSGASPQNAFSFIRQYTNPTYIPRFRVVSLKVAASGGTGYIGSEEFGTYIDYAWFSLVGWKDSDKSGVVWCTGGLSKPGSSYKAFYFTNNNEKVFEYSGSHFVFLNSSGQLAIRNNSGDIFQYQGLCVTSNK